MRIARIGVRPVSETEFLNNYLSRVRAAIDAVDASQLGQLANAIMETVAKGGHVFFMGNGGSAATATHYVNDLVMAYARTNRVVRASSLSDNAALVTGISNDLSFDEVFEYQLRALAQPGDLIVAISASGNSPNLVRAVDYAKGAGLRTAAVLGFDGGVLKSLAGTVVHVATGIGDYGPAEDAHLVVNHAVAALIRSTPD
jgi:D-sedoheptulose 7-phosphate isomerase